MILKAAIFFANSHSKMKLLNWKTGDLTVTLQVNRGNQYLQSADRQ